jgi:uncharacterized membrane protein
MKDFSIWDIAALTWYLVAWAGFGWLTDYSRWHRGSLSRLMDQHRRNWMKSLQTREVRMVDASIMSSLQNGTAFFASTSVLALGASLTLLNQAERVVTIFSEMPLLHVVASKEVLELKVFGLATVYGYAFFKFGWAYRLYNYGAILIGAIPPLKEDPAVVRRATERAAEMQIHAGHHFHWGLRSLFFSIGYLGWFLGPFVFFATSTLIVAVLTHRQFWSPARQALLDRSLGTTDALPRQGAGNSAVDLPPSQ